MVTARILRITGKVQGVFFRASAKEQADRLGVTGWARNCEDGSVEIHAEGAEDVLNQFIAWCNEGPAQARVTGVEQENTLPEEEDDFAVM